MFGKESASDKPKDAKRPGRVDIILSKLIPSDAKRSADAKRSGDKMDSEEDPEQDDKQMEYESAAEEIISAVESKDAKALSEALHSFVILCSSHDEESEE